MSIVVKSIGPKEWANVSFYKNCHDDIGSYFLENGSRYTGLTKEDEKRLSEELGWDLKPNAEFWDTFFIRMTDDDLHLNVNDPYDELKYLFLKSHKDIQESLKDKKAGARYVIFNEDEEAKEDNKRNKLKRRAIKEFDKLSSTDIRRALRLYGYKADTMSAEQAEAKLYSIVEDSPQKFIDIWVDNSTRDTQFIVEAALSKNILRKNRNIYSYGTEPVGHGIEEAIAYLDDKKNQEIRKIILDEIEVK